MPHNGCPHQCSFCNQKQITGQQYQPNAQDVDSAVQIAISSLGEECKNAEIAFFGGSFTAIDRGYMISLLEAAAPYVKSGKFHGIRISTRPDAIDDDVLALLKSYGVTAIELGAQSMDNNVLIFNNRGHSDTDVERASALIRSYGFSLGLQMMIGLYKSTPEKDIETAHRLASLMPDTVRIYPTVIMRGTHLNDLYASGEYVPYDMSTAIDICAELITFFESKGIAIIRLGLHDSDSLRSEMTGGLWHPAFKELCQSKIMLEKCKSMLADENIPQGKITLLVNPKDVSRMTGQKKSNILALADIGYNVTVKQSDSVCVNDIVIER